jgi:hypothetical protein
MSRWLITQLQLYKLRFLFLKCKISELKIEHSGDQYVSNDGPEHEKHTAHIYALFSPTDSLAFCN